MARVERSDEEKAQALAALDANGGDVSKTARQLGLPRTTLNEWKAGRVTNGVTELRQVKKEGLADALERIAYKCVEVLPDKLDLASAKDAAVVLGVSVEKMQLLREKPTSIQVTETALTPEERAARVSELLERGENRALAVGTQPGRTGVVGPAARGPAN